MCDRKARQFSCISPSNVECSLPRQQSGTVSVPSADTPQAVREGATKYALREFQGRASRKRGCVSGDHFGAKRWGIGLGFACGIVLAALTISDVPFFGHSRNTPRTHSLPRPQTREALANVDPFAEVVEAKPPTTNRAIVKDLRNAERDPATASPPPIRTAQKLPADVPPARSIVSPLVPPPRDLDENPEEQLKFARFLIKAQLAPLAAEPLRKVVKEAPDTSIAREAQHTLDVISRN
jgi:hypothetical protein